MARPLRIEFPGAVYHLTARGNRQEAIFLNDEDRFGFLDILGKTVTRYNWLCHAYCLMDNHYHLLVETIDANLSIGMRQLNGMYTQFSNRNHKKVGHIFQGRFKSILVERDSYLLELCRYIVCNPVKAGLCSKPEDWKWSSYNPTVSGRNIPDYLSVDWILSQFSEDSKIAQKLYREFVTAGLTKKSSPWDDIVGQVVLGGEEFIEQVQTYLAGTTANTEIPRSQRVAGRPTLAEMFVDENVENKTKRNEEIRRAHLTFGYSLKEIADSAGIHYTTVSRIVSREPEK